MAKGYYFHISAGLRGSYMPDSVYCVRVTSRRELKSLIEREAEFRREGTVGLSRRAVTAFVAEAWRRRDDSRWTLDLALPFSAGSISGAGDARRGEKPFALFLSRSTRADYLAEREADQ